MTTKLVALGLLTAMLAGCGTTAVLTAPVAPGALRAAGSQRQDTALIKHVLYFDVDGDRVLTMSEMNQRMRALGVGPLQSSLVALAVGSALGPATGGAFKIKVDEIAKGIHPSDTGNYDKQGNFVPSRFEAMFARADENRDGALDEAEVGRTVDRNKTDFIGNKASKGEFSLLMKIGADRKVKANGDTLMALSKERLQAFYDGSLFYQIARLPQP